MSIKIDFIFKADSKFDVEENNRNIRKLQNESMYEIDMRKESFEVGSITKGVNSENERRVRSKEALLLDRGSTIRFNHNLSDFSYGINIYNLNGAWNGVDYGWLKSDNLFYVEEDCLVRLVIKYNDERIITSSYFNSITDNSFTFTKKYTRYLEDEVSRLDADKVKNEAINSISVEYGRISGASYVFVRIPKILYNGKMILPKVALTSSDGSIDGPKRLTLKYARDNGAIFTINVGLFNITTVKPVVQLIIDGVSLINDPMTSDNGVPIHPNECYPLAIDGNGNLTTYPRNADTSDMIADGVKYAVTAWGKLVDNFEITSTDIEHRLSTKIKDI